jgi:hypothetical protein
MERWAPGPTAGRQRPLHVPSVDPILPNQQRRLTSLAASTTQTSDQAVASQATVAPRHAHRSPGRHDDVMDDVEDAELARLDWIVDLRGPRPRTTRRARHRGDRTE